MIDTEIHNYHDASLKTSSNQSTQPQTENVIKFNYNFENFFHPFIGELIAQLNKKSIADIFDVSWLSSNIFTVDFFNALYSPINNDIVNSHPKEIDVSISPVYGPYSNYNWEFFFHIPLMIATHLSKNQRFPEAQRWFHYIFNPLQNDLNGDPDGCWKFIGFRNQGDSVTIEDIVRSLSNASDGADDKNNESLQNALKGYDSSISKPFQPHAIARTRLIAYQYNVVMKYMDNLIAWGDNLFQQDTIETINEATQIYILAANVLGKKPEQIPQTANVRPKSFNDLRNAKLGPIGDALVDLESQFPLNLSLSSSTTTSSQNTSALFGIGQTLYFCIPPNQKLLDYWDTVANRLFKIRHCMNIAGIVRPLALFDPPIDPGMLVKAAAAGIDIGSIVSGLNQPAGPVRSLFYIQKASELCNEVRSLGNALLSAFEKGDAESLALVRQKHETQIQQMTLQVKFLQWKQAQENTTSLLTSRATALERLNYYKRLLALPDDSNAPATLTIDHSETADSPPKLTEDNFDDAYAELVGQYNKQLTLQQYSALRLAGDTSPGIVSGFSGSGKIYLTKNEDSELNTHLPAARDFRSTGSTISAAASAFLPTPDMDVDIHF